MSTNPNHSSLRTKFRGLVEESHGVSICHYRGIQYGKIRTRYAAPEPVDCWNGEEINAQEFGPQCPQPPVDVNHLLRLPTEIKSPKIREDEFNCLNLNISMPRNATTSSGLPVIVWVHGGSQVVTFASAANPVCDPSRIVAESVRLGRPLIFVTFNYRLNIFAFGDGEGEVNLALQDQRILIDWVVRNISEFGGSQDRITLAGESAGAVYVHAHLLTGVKVARAILASGSLYLSPPQPRLAAGDLLQKLSTCLQKSSKGSLKTATASDLVDALVECGINSMWLQDEPRLHGWEDRMENVDSLMTGDVEFESILWRNGIEAMSAENISSCFDAAQEHAPFLKSLYRIDLSRPTQSKNGALDFLTDARFVLPAMLLAKKRAERRDGIYQYVIDQSNPWQASSRSHHGIDLIFAFGGVDLSHDQGAQHVGKVFRESWILFANEIAPWAEASIFAFGPYGECKSISMQEFSYRRRLHCIETLENLGNSILDPVFKGLAAGRISLHN